MASALQASPGSLLRSYLLESLSIPRELAFGYLGLLLFMMGDGVESGYLAHFLHGEGVSQEKVALMFTIYGALAAMGARYSGAVADVWGARFVMSIGLAIWAALQLVFLGFALRVGNYYAMLASYGLRGLGYPLFAYGFLVLITNKTPPRRLGSAVG
ncbi:MAG: MFS transporter, partial [Verrucomicrobia bacterium]|nr:MFS transporter [Verrucomicrobiota bacterium]